MSLYDVVADRLDVVAEGASLHGPFISPDGTRFLVSGETLREYSQEGVLLREITPPPGTQVTEAAWSPDGTRIVYVLGPKGYRPGL